MSSQPERHEKQFDPTPQRLRKAREEGNVFRSPEIVSVALLLTATGVLYGGGHMALSTLQETTARLFAEAATTEWTIIRVRVLLASLSIDLAPVLFPLFGVLAVVGVGMNVLQTGWHPTAKPLQPKLSRLSPMQGIKRIFSAKGLFNLGKSIVKIVLVGPLAYTAIRGHAQELVTLHMLPLPAIMQTASGWLLTLALQLLGALLVLSAVDFAFERWRYHEDLKMTRQEVKDETRDSEGDPHMKGQRRRIAQEMARRPRLDHAVLQADVVVTNPTHYAIALRYNPDDAPAPRVLAKGIRKRAQRLKALAREHGVPTVENRPLARALYDTVPEEHEIPEELYAAVAAVLAEVYRAKAGFPPTPPAA